MPTAAEARAMPEELAAAITRLEARKDTTQRQREGTVPIGEVVRQLGIDATPEEVLAEVQAGHAEQGKKQNRRLSLKQRLSLLLAAGAVVIGYTMCVNYPYMVASPTSSVATAPTIAVIPAGNNQASHIHLDPNLLVSDAYGKLVMLSEVVDNQPVHCYYYNGSFHPYSPGSALVSWTLIKHEGKTYVRGWMPRMSKQVLEADGADICASKSEGAFVVPVTLLVSGFKVLSASADNIQNAVQDSAFHAQDIHIDNHTYEKWQP